MVRISVTKSLNQKDDNGNIVVISLIEATGLSTDEKPTKNTANGSIFVEVDTGKVFFFNEESLTWVEQFSFQG